ncbi:hypothetical protein [Pontibacter sp. HSC-36F09]|uniref:hypothetical protein n=1 Tax=Pontibacter sp. HSC-36F09 TaxID=2910966 RepID=UPI0020A01902|nr:hypothetical protein [Pontibacter sp. HSC-36F09]MCP2045356.1 ABC-type ATPase involved in cell division [Pontibacter sp. HSC-36F09]
MELTIRNISKSYLNGAQTLKGINWIILLGLCSLVWTNEKIQYTLTCLLATQQQPDEGHVLFEDIDVVKQLAQLLQFILDTMF